MYKSLYKTFSVITILAMMLMALPMQSAGAATPTELFFSEYIEGSSNNKALEIYNGTGAAINLGTGGYNVQMFFNGSASAGLTINLTGTVANGDVFVLAHSSANATVLSQADQTNGAGWFNGDDAVVLRKGTTVIDVIGQIGFDPGTEWGTGLASTADNSLARKADICAGDPDGSNTFDPSVQWDGFATDTFTGLGAYTANCEITTIEPKINEFSASTAGTDVEYVEIYGAPNTEYSAHTILEIEGEGTGIGVVDEVISVGTTDANGLWLGSLPATALENGTLSLLLVKNFTGALNNDLDTNNDGAFDVTPWDTIIDSVAVNDGTAGDVTYGGPTLGPNYDDLSSFAPGGASRIPDGLDTDSATDWVRNDFDLYGIPGFTGTQQIGEAVNTPGALNQEITVIVDPFGACFDPATLIHTIQGSGTASTDTGNIRAVEAVVVATFQGTGQIGGYFVQEEDADADNDPLTSEGLRVFDNTNSPSVGDVIRIRGSVTEFNGLTELTNILDFSVCGTGTASPTTVNLPVTSLNDFERYEGMAVTLPQSLVISEYFNYERFGEMVLALPLDGETRPFTPTAIDEPGAPAQSRALANSLRRITLDDGLSTQNPSFVRHPNGSAFGLDNAFRGGDTVQNVVGVMDYSFDLYRIQPTGPADYTSVNPRPAEPESVGGSVRIAAMNTLNYFLTPDNIQEASNAPDNPADNLCGPVPNLECRGWDGGQTQELPRQRAKLLAALVGLDADVIGLNELENTVGVEPLADIIAGLNEQLGPGTYAYIDTGTIGTDAIKVGLIYKPAVVTPVGAYKILDSTVDPRFIDTKSRPAMAQTFEEVATGARFTVVANHLKSKGSDCNDIGDPDTGDGQGNCNQTRKAAAQALVDWIATDPTGSGDADYIIMGDLNSYAQEDPIDVIKAGADETPGTFDDYTNLINKYQGTYAYSYVFDGQAGYLDHALSFPSLTAQVTGAADWHINADEPDLLDYDTSFKPAAQEAIYEPNAYRSSDHDPVVVGLDLLHYNFSGFFQPVDNLPTLNTLRAGNSVPVKFSLDGNQGLDIFLSGYPLSRPISCDGTAPSAPVEETVNAGGSSLSYDPITDQYSYVWKTDRSWAGTCRQLVVVLKDGTLRYANFSFK